MSTRGVAPPGGADLFYDPVDDLTYAISEGLRFPTIRIFDVETSVWTTVAEPQGVLTVDLPVFVMDPVDGVIYGYEVGRQLWAYDIASNAWAEVEQGGRRPPSHWEHTAAMFDPAVGRIVLSGLRSNESEGMAPIADMIAETWTFDPGTGAWKRVSMRNSPYRSMNGWTYNEDTRTIILVADDGVASFDATANRWSVPQRGTGWPDLTRLGHGVVHDVVNGRVLVLGGNVRTAQGGSQNNTDVWAYDPAAKTWTELVPREPDGALGPE